MASALAIKESSLIPEFSSTVSDTFAYTEVDERKMSFLAAPVGKLSTQSCKIAR